MSTSDQPAGSAGQEQAAAWGAPTSPQNRPVWSTRKVVIAVVVAVLLAGGGGAAIAAAATGTSGAGGSSSGGPGGFGGGMGGMGGGMGGRFGGGMDGGLTNALHGDFTASNGSSGYVTERLQTGKVTAVSSTSLTLDSADGYTGTYVINSATSVDGGQDKISSVKTGDTVTVTAKLSGSTATATTVLDRAQLQNGQGGGMGGPGGQSGQGGQQGGPGGN